MSFPNLEEKVNSLTKVPVVWSDDIEKVLDDIRLNSYTMSEVHRKRFLSLKNFSNYFDIPVIIISAINTIISVGVQSFLIQSTISITNCILSAICGIIVSIKLYLSIQSQMELELTTSKEFYTLSVDIYKTLSLSRSNRGDDGIEFLNHSFKTYSVLVQKSSILQKKINDEMVPIKINSLYSIYNIPSNLANEVFRATNNMSHLLTESNIVINDGNNVKNDIKIDINEKLNIQNEIDEIDKV